MTTIVFTLKGLDGAPIPNTTFKVTAAYPGEDYDPELTLPEDVTFTTNGSGVATVSLVATTAPYFVSRATNTPDDLIAFKLYVPDSDETLAAELLYVDLGKQLKLLNDRSLYTLIETKVTVLNAMNQAVTMATLAATSAQTATAKADIATTKAAEAVAAQAASTHTKYVANKAAALALVGSLASGTTVVVDADESATPAGVSVRYIVDDGALTSPVHTSAALIEFIHEGAGAVPRNFRLKASEFLSVADFGAVLDGVTDDTAACQAAIDAATALGYRAVYFPVGNAKITSNLMLDSCMTYFGDGFKSQITQNTANQPVLVSRNYYHLEGATPLGNMIIRDMRINGGQSAGSNNHGILIRDYYTTVSHVLIATCGGDGVKMTHLNDDTSVYPEGESVGGTLVENRLFRVTVSNCKGYGFYLGEDSNNKITDGFVEDCIVRSTATSPSHLYIGSAAGWKVDGIHHYGDAPPTGPSIYLLNSYHTSVDNVYIEGFGTHGLVAAKTQRALALSNIHVKNAISGASAVRIDKSSLVSACEVSVAGLHVVNNSSNTVVGISTMSSGVSVRTAACSYTNTGAGSITKYSGSGPIYYMEKAQVTGALTESTNQRALVYEGMALSNSVHKSFNTTGGLTVVVTLPVKNLGNYQSAMGTIHIQSRANYTGTRRVSYVGAISIQSKVNGTDPWVVALDDLGTPSGFDAAPGSTPVATITDAGDGSGTVTITFTAATHTDGYGAIKMILGTAESA